MTEQQYHDEYASDTGPFSIVPEWVTTSTLSHGAVRLYALLARYADYSTGEAWPSRATLALRLRMSTDSIDRLSKELQDLGAVEVIRRHDGSRWKSNLYIVKRVPPPGVSSGRTDTATPSRSDTAEAGRTSAATPSRIDAAGTRASEQEPTERDKTPSVSETMTQVFNLWLEETGKKSGRTMLDTKRAARIKWALNNYELDDVLDAVRGWKRSPFHAGQNEHGKVYNDLTLLLRNSDRLEYFRDCWRAEVDTQTKVPETWHRLREMMGEEDGR